MPSPDPEMREKWKKREKIGFCDIVANNIPRACL